VFGNKNGWGKRERRRGVVYLEGRKEEKERRDWDCFGNENGNGKGEGEGEKGIRNGNVKGKIFIDRVWEMRLD
jgi:hypothetical protein